MDRSLSAQDAARLLERLSRCSEVTQLDSAEEGSEAEALVHALVDIAESLRAALEEHYPRIGDPGAADEELLDAIDDLREELGHVLYHLHDSRTFRIFLRAGTRLHPSTRGSLRGRLERGLT
jgi:hypothetical protein